MGLYTSIKVQNILFTINTLYVKKGDVSFKEMFVIGVQLVYIEEETFVLHKKDGRSKIITN